MSAQPVRKSSEKGPAGLQFRVLPEGERPKDRRLGPLRTLYGYFPCKPLASVQEWSDRAAEVRRRVLVALGLWPFPPKTPLNSRVYAPVERDDYTVWKVHFESLPGHFVTGLLYRPRIAAPEGRKRPGVLCPHGHWTNGRYYDAATQPPPGNIRQQIADGAERFLEGGRNPIQARCVQLARMGCVAFSYDMEGYADSVQLAHAPGNRPEMNTPENWGYFSPAAELHLQNMMGLQTWNSIRALDFLLELAEIDPKRIAVTGASGGGTQTFILGAVDDRPALLFPAVMVSTAMQGGCTCENAPYLRIDAGNIDIAALAAHPSAFRDGLPRPLGMTTADDWTKGMPEKGFPELAQLYRDLGAADRVALFPFPQFQHNFNAVSRVRMYNFVNRWFGLGLEEPVLERDYAPLTPEEQCVWDAAHPRPAGPAAGPDHERALLRWWTERAREQLDALAPRDPTGVAEYRRVVGGAWKTIIGRTLEAAGEVRVVGRGEDRAGAVRVRRLLLNNTTYGEQVPAVLLHAGNDRATRLALVLMDAGKQGLLDESGDIHPEAAKLLHAGIDVLGIDMLYQGEFRRTARPLKRQRMAGSVKAPYAAYTFGYNPPLFCRRVHDVLTALAAAAALPPAPCTVILRASGTVAGPVAAGALAVCGDAVAEAEIDVRGFRFADLDRLDHPMFVPGAVKYGDLPGLLALRAPYPLVLAGISADDHALRPLVAMYRALERSEALAVNRTH